MTKTIRKEVISEVIVSKFMWFVRDFIDREDDDGQGLAEYALILALIAIVAIISLIFLGSQVSNKLSVIGGAISSVAP